MHGHDGQDVPREKLISMNEYWTHEQAYSDPSRAADPYHLPDCIVFQTPDGWFWQSQMPGCLPDSDPIGPFDTRQEALDDCQDIG